MYGLRETVWCNSTLALPTPRSEMRQKFVVAKYRKFSPGAYMIFQRPLLRKFLKIQHQELKAWCLANNLREN